MSDGKALSFNGASRLVVAAKEARKAGKLTGMREAFTEASMGSLAAKKEAASTSNPQLKANLRRLAAAYAKSERAIGREIDGFRASRVNAKRLFDD